MHDLKETVITLLKESKFEELADLVARKKTAIKYVKRLLYEIDELLRWRAIEGMGVVADRLAGKDPEVVRNIIRSLLWSINEESGGIGWSAPECVGEIVYRMPEMFGEFASIIISFADEFMLRRGVLWAAGRIAQSRPGLVEEDIKNLTLFLTDPDPVVRGYTLRLLDIVGDKLFELPSLELRSSLLNDPGQVPLYENRQVLRFTVGELAAKVFK